MREACRSGEGNPGYELGSRFGTGLAGGPRQDLHRGCARRLRAVGGAADRGVDRKARQGARPRAGRVAGRPRPPGRPARAPRSATRSGRSSSAGSSRSPSPARTSRSIRSTSPTSRRRRTRRTRCSRRAGSRSSSRGLDRGAARAGAGGRLRLRPGLRRPGDRSRCHSSPGCASESGLVVTHGYGPRYQHSTGQLHKGGPNTGLFLQVIDDPGDELPIPGKPFGFRRLIRAQAAGDLETLKERGRRVARVRLEDI